jgi:hypothetical protein
MAKAHPVSKLSTTTANAIDQLHSVVFVAGCELPRKRPELLDPYYLAAKVEEGCPLRVFQRHGISSKVVAEALRAGVLVAVTRDEFGADVKLKA